MSDKDKIIPGSIEDRKAKKEARYAELFNPAGFVDTSKEQFISDHKGKMVGVDLNEAWKWIKKNLPKAKK